MKITLFSLGEVKNTHSEAIEAEYLKRLPTGLKTKINEISTRKFSSLSEAERKLKEGEALTQRLNKDDYLILLDEKGETLDSFKFASLIKKHMLGGTKSMVFAIGGAYGWDEKIKKQAKSIISLSPMTYTYSFARLILVEQLYRAHTIINGIPYHKD